MQAINIISHGSKHGCKTPNGYALQACFTDHVKPGSKWDEVDTSTLTEPIKLNAAEAKSVAVTLAGLKANNALIRAEKRDADADASSMGEMMFDKIYGCAACHQIEPKIWMPNKHVPEGNIQILVNYIMALSEENFDE